MSDVVNEAAGKLAKESAADIFLFNGELNRKYVLQFLDEIHNYKSSKNIILLLVTDGGDPDAAYKIARYIQDHYEKFTLLVPGICKSAGTLIAVGANEIAFSPYGELGPIDIQTYKEDNVAQRHSGLTITEGLDSLIAKAIAKHTDAFIRILEGTRGVVSFHTAAEASADLIKGLMQPIFAQIDPFDVGDKARAMRIADDYGKRLNARTKNLKPRALASLTRTYPSHSFVIDKSEAEILFENVRDLTESERDLVKSIGPEARHESRKLGPPICSCLAQAPQSTKENSDATTNARGNSKGDGRDTEGSVKTPISPANKPRGRRRKQANA